MSSRKRSYFHTVRYLRYFKKYAIILATIDDELVTSIYDYFSFWVRRWLDANDFAFKLHIFFLVLLFIFLIFTTKVARKPLSKWKRGCIFRLKLCHYLTFEPLSRKIAFCSSSGLQNSAFDILTLLLCQWKLHSVSHHCIAEMEFQSKALLALIKSNNNKH